MAASQPWRRIVSTGSGDPSAVSHTVCVVSSLVQGAGVGEQGQVGDPAPGGAGPGDQPDQGVRFQMVELDVLTLVAVPVATANAASNTAAMRASVSGSTWRWV